MVVPETLGTMALFGGSDGTLGLHPELEEPPEFLSDWEPERILVGHGESIYSEAYSQLQAVLDTE